MEGQKSVTVDLLALQLFGILLTFSHFLFTNFYKIQGRALGFSTKQETLVPHVLVISPSAGMVYHGSFSSIAIQSNLPGKTIRMTLNWRRIAL